MEQLLDGILEEFNTMYLSSPVSTDQAEPSIDTTASKDFEDNKENACDNFQPHVTPTYSPLQLTIMVNI